MKKFLLFTALVLIMRLVSAQYCGNSGTSQCIPSGVVNQPGLSPLSHLLPPFQNNVNSTTVIEFQNFNVVYFGTPPTAFTLSSLRIDSIENLPEGLCWASDKPNNTYANSESGCIKVNGVPCDSTGQYKLRIIATATTSSPFVLTAQVDADSVGLFYYVRVINNGDPVTPVDTFTLIPFVPYGGVCQPALPPSVNLGADQSICTGSSVTLNPTITNGVSPFTYSWQAVGDTLNCDTCSSPLATLNQNSTFIVTVTDAANGTATDTIDFSVTGSGGIFEISASGATSVCKGNSVTLHAVQNNTFTNQWQLDGVDVTGEDDSVYVVSSVSGTYSVVYESGNCNANSNSIVVAVNDTPSVSVNPTGPVEICNGTSALLQSTSNMQVSYLWQVNGNNLISATNPNYYASLAAAYRVIVTTADNCADTSNTVVVTTRVCSGIDDVEEGNLKVYPNPVKQELFIQSDLFAAGNVSVSLFDVAGKKQIVTHRVQNNLMTLNIGHLAAGVYHIRLNLPGKEISRKFIKID